MLGLVTSANVACGFHAGDATTLRRTCALAAERGVVVGAQVAYRDLAGFGRRFIDVNPGELTDDVLYQIGALEGLCRVAGTRVRYVKPHGALYNATVHHEAQAQAVVEAVRAYDAALPVLGLPGSRLLAAAEAAGLRAVPEFFVDRGYTPEGDARSAVAGRRAAARPGGGRRRGWCGWSRTAWYRGGRHRRGRPRRVGVRARGLARRGRDGHCRPRRPGRRGGGAACRSPEQALVDDGGDGPRVRAMGDAAVLVELADLDAVLAHAAAIEAAGWPGVVDVVPGARTVVVTVRPGHRPRRAAPGRAGRWTSTPVDAADGDDRRDPRRLRRPGPGRGRRAHRARRRRGGGRAHRHAVAGRVRRLRARLRLPDRRRSPAARRAAVGAAHERPGRVRSGSRASSAASTPAARRAAGSSSAARTPRSGTPPAPRPLC